MFGCLVIQKQNWISLHNILLKKHCLFASFFVMLMLGGLKIGA